MSIVRFDKHFPIYFFFLLSQVFLHIFFFILHKWFIWLQPKSIYHSLCAYIDLFILILQFLFFFLILFSIFFFFSFSAVLMSLSRRSVDRSCRYRCRFHRSTRNRKERSDTYWKNRFISVVAISHTATSFARYRIETF